MSDKSGPWWLMKSRVEGNWCLGTGGKHVDNRQIIVVGDTLVDGELLAKRIQDLLNATDVLPTERNSELHYCSVCGDWQGSSPSGLVCQNGHGGAESIDNAVKASHLRAVWRGMSERERLKL